MTVAAGAAKAGPYTGNDVTSSFPFEFKVFADADILVVETVIATEVETDLVLNTNYTVTRNVDQDNDPGGTITYKVAGVTTALPSTKKLTIVGSFDFEQPTDIPNGGSFYAQIVENALDRCTLLIKQLKEQVDRAALVPVSSSYTAEDLTDDIIALAAIESDITTVSGIAANVTTVAGISADVTTVAGIAADVTAVAGIAADVTAVAAIDTDVTTCAANIAAIIAAPTEAANAAASASAASGSESAAAASAAAAAATLASALWRDVVFVTSASSPVTVVQADNGKLYVADTTGGAITFNLPQISGITLPFAVGVKLDAGGNAVTINRAGTDTIDGATSKTISVVGGGTQLIADTSPAPDVWTAVDFGSMSANYTDEVFTDGVGFTAGVSTTVTLSNSYGSETNLIVHFDAAFQGPDTYSLSGTTLTFAAAIPGGVGKVYVKGGSSMTIGTPADGTVTSAKLANSVVSGLTTVTTARGDYVMLADTSDGGNAKKGLLSDVLQIVQIVEATPYTTHSSTGTAIPYDDTVPQNTEGAEWLTVSITPTSATNRLRIEADMPFVAGSGAIALIAALFQDSSASAIATSVATAGAANYSVCLRVVHEMASGTTSATTFKLRAGPGTGTMYVNGDSGGRKFGGVAAVRLRVTEIKA